MYRARTSSESYLNIPAIITAADYRCRCNSSGLWFLSENAEFAEIVESSGFIFIGPRPEHIRLMGNKVSAIMAMKNLVYRPYPGSASCCNDQ